MVRLKILERLPSLPTLIRLSICRVCFSHEMTVLGLMNIVLFDSSDIRLSQNGVIIMLWSCFAESRRPTKEFPRLRDRDTAVLPCSKTWHRWHKFVPTETCSMWCRMLILTGTNESPAVDVTRRGCGLSRFDWCQTISDYHVVFIN
jgi:hypothetical protein